MRKWGYGINSFHKTAYIWVEKSSWWVFALDRSIEWFCGIIPHIRFPKIRMKLKDAEDIEINDGTEWTTWQDWYGDLSQYFHCIVHMPIFNYCYSKIKCKSIEIDYDLAKETFYESDKKFWDWEISLNEEDNKSDRP